MITQVGAVDLTPNITAVEAVRDAQRSLGREYHTNQGDRFVQYGTGVGDNPAVMLWNESADNVLIEKISITAPAVDFYQFVYFATIAGYAQGAYGMSLKVPSAVSPDVGVRTKINAAPTTPFGYARLLAETTQVFDFGGILLGPAKGIGVYGLGVARTMIVGFIWRENIPV